MNRVVFKNLFFTAVAIPVITVFVLIVSSPGRAQTTLSGDIAGTVTDTTGAAVPGAKLTLKSLATGSTETTATGASGEYRFSLLSPGQYTLNATAAGFQAVQRQLSVNVGVAAQADIKLSIGSTSETVEVTGAAPLVQTENADTSTTFSMQQVQNIPNPGNDITFMGQLAPGSVINSTNQAANGMLGYGNFSSFGLPATSNNFTVNGTDENDPFFNINNSGATNLLLGNNEIAETTVTSTAFSAQFGALGGAQLNEITRAGSDQLHGNLVYWWNGRAMNANSYFNNQQGVPRPFVNDNQWAVAVGGPIKRQKLFFFVDTEGIRFIFPTSSQVLIPSASYQTSVLASVGANNPSEVPFYQKMFALYNGAPGASNAIPYLSPAGLNPDVNTFRASTSSGANEWLMASRLDYNIGQNDKFFVRYKMDRGFQPTYSDPINSAFDLVSTQPEYEGQLVETHSFSSSAVNQFLMYASYYDALFEPANTAQNTATLDGTVAFYDGTNPATGLTDSFNVLNPYGFFSNGRRATQYGGADDFSLTRGAHTIRLGWILKRDDISDFDPLEYFHPENIAIGPYYPGATATNIFNNGYALETQQDFPLHLSDPIALYQMGAYAEDDWNVTPRFKLNYGLRLEHNSNPICTTDCFSRLNGEFFSLAASSAATGDSAGVPYNQLISANQHRVFHGYEHVAVEPRIGFTYSPEAQHGNLVFRGGFGIFSDAFPGTIADSLLFNPPNDLSFAVFGGLLDPSQPNSGSNLAAGNAAAFRNAFQSGGSYNSILAANPTFSQPAFTSASQSIHYPVYDEWSLQVQRQFGRSTAITLGYVGNRGYHEPDQMNSINAYGFAGLPSSAPLPSFGQVNVIESEATSNYNGGLVTVRHREKYIDLTVNYTYSHALDEISNGGFLPFNPANTVYPINPYNLSANYGNSDYDVRHDLTGNYVITLPYWGRSRLLTENWQFSGTVFFHTGFPYSVFDGNTGQALQSQNYYGNLPATEVSRPTSYHCSAAAVYNFTSGTGKPCLDINDFAAATSVDQRGRNQFFGPRYFDTDFTVQKGFALVPHEGLMLKVGAQFFNVLNHPNFAQPISNIDSSQFGTIDGTVSPPTSIFGFGLGGDASPRIVQLKASVQF